MPRANKEPSSILAWINGLEARINAIDGEKDANILDHYPDHLWRGTGFRPRRYPARWIPPLYPPRNLTAGENGEYVTSRARAVTQQYPPNINATARRRHNRVGINECRDLIDLAAFRNWADVVAPPVSAQGFTTPKRRNQDLKNEYEWHRIDLKDSRARLVDELLAYLLLYLSRSDTPNGLPPKKPDEDQDEDDEPGKGQGVGQSWARAIIVE